MSKINKNIVLVPKKKVIGTIKLFLPVSKDFDKATVSRAISQFKINIADFTKKYTKAIEKLTNIKYKVPVKITVYKGSIYDINIKVIPTTSDLVREILNIKTINSMKDLKQNEFVKISKDQVIGIAKKKQNELNVKNIDGAVKCIMGTLKSMRIVVV
ncbi:hypothetical protein AB836_00330 [Rickettsiales bacterium (ex Bugula neritina AB1)]|nr:hypothetical protein AB836_00330 [Rickettsiales bacterium (ex Bugula neritina AB1)]